MAIQSHFFVSVVIFLHNDADILENLVVETSGVLKNNYQHFELVLVDSGSNDSTTDIVNHLLRQYEDIRYIKLSRDFGKDAAISAGLDSAIGDAIVILDPQSDPPALIPEMINKVRQTNGIVFGIKNGEASAEPLYYRWGKKIFHLLCKKMLAFTPPEEASFFIGLNRQALNAILQMGSRFKFVRVFSAYSGFGKQVFTYTPKYRRAKPRHLPFLQAVGYAVDIITNNSVYPLRMVSFLGLLVSGANLLYIIYILLIFLFKKNVVEGWVTGSLQTATMFLMLFLVLTVLVRYVGILLLESKNVPSYIIQEETNSSVILDLQKKKNIMLESLDETNITGEK